MRAKRLGTAAEIILLALVMVLLILNITGNLMFAVVEGKSMEPLLQTGDLVLVSKASPNQIHVGDIVVYRSTYGELIIHRVIKVMRIDGRYVYLIKGDNNLVPDGDIPYNMILGKVIGLDGNVFKIPVIGYLTLGFRSIFK